MIFNPPLFEGILIKRYKRFMADVVLSGDPPDKITTIYCPNTGSMKNCQFTSSRVWCSRSDNSRRKYPLTWEIIEINENDLELDHKGSNDFIRKNSYFVGINTQMANLLVREALEKKVIEQLAGYTSLFTEVKYGKKSRVDFLLKEKSGADCYVEVKSVTLCAGNGKGLFPDAVTARGTRHLEELITMSRAGNRAVLLFCVQHGGIDYVEPASMIDPDYARTLIQAKREGVEPIAYRADISPLKIELTHEIPVVIHDEHDSPPCVNIS